MNRIEQRAHDAILSLVRSREGKRRFGSLTGLRVLYGSERKWVGSLEFTEPKPGSKCGERQSKCFAEGDTWAECVTQLQEKGFMPRDTYESVGEYGQGEFHDEYGKPD